MVCKEQIQEDNSTIYIYILSIHINRNTLLRWQAVRNQEITWLLKEKYQCVEGAPVLNESPEEIKDKYPWGAAFFADCERLAAGEPLAYIIGHVPFLDCTIHLDSKPLIPCPETEFWTEKAITIIKQTFPRQGLGLALGLASGEIESQGSTPIILDLCAGSGAIGVAVAKAIPTASLTLAELDPTHLPTIQKNLEKNTIIYDSGNGARVKVCQSDLFTNLAGNFDFILCNPPYIDAAAKTIEASVEAYEPHLALFGGKGGLEVIERILEGARAKLAPQGELWLEHEPFQTTALQNLARQFGFSVITYPDQYGTTRYSVCTPSVAK